MRYSECPLCAKSGHSAVNPGGAGRRVDACGRLAKIGPPTLSTHISSALPDRGPRLRLRTVTLSTRAVKTFGLKPLADTRLQPRDQKQPVAAAAHRHRSRPSDRGWRGHP